MVWMLSTAHGRQPDASREDGSGPKRSWLGKSLDALPGREQVDRMIARETARAERNGQPFSVVLFRLKGGRAGRGGARRGLSRSERRLALTLLRRVRLTDDVGWFDDRHLCVLLPDTPADGARIFVDKLCEEVARNSPRPLSVIYTYPGDGRSGGGRNDDNDRNGPNGGNGNGPPDGHGPVLAGGRSRIFGAGGFGSHNYAPRGGEPVAAVMRSTGGDPFGQPTLRRGGLATLAAPRGATVAAKAVSKAAVHAKDPVASPAVQPLHELLVRPMPRWKRAIDVLGAAVGLLLLAPLFAAVAAAIKFSGPGPVIFTQKRSGRGGRTFTIYKFRTMCADAEAKKQALRKLSEQDGPAFKLTNDPRITRVGHLLRKTSVDELPQLWNVLKGDMSLVGPRPLPVDESAGCERWQKRRLDVTPGLTCIWQVEGRSEVSFAEWVRMDVKYMRRLTLFHDLSILFKTVPAVLLRKGAR